jgi:hypothetical protein
MKRSHLERNNTDIQRVEGVQMHKEDYRAGNTTKTKRHAMTITHDPAERGSILMPTLCDLKADVRSLLRFVARFDSFVHYRGDVVFISQTPVPDVAWITLLETNDILCGCTPKAQCDCHANVLAHPSRATAVPEWLSM